MPYQPPIELAVGAPLQKRKCDGATIVGIRDSTGDWVELKRISR